MRRGSELGEPVGEDAELDLHPGLDDATAVSDDAKATWIACPVFEETATAKGIVLDPLASSVDFARGLIWPPRDQD